MTSLELAPYLEQKDLRPKAGRQILAQYDQETIVVYQAYRTSIGKFAATNGCFGGGFSLDRMTWIKPGFLWMMYRCGWGKKPGQEVVLAIWLKRRAFEEILRQAVLSAFHPGLWPTEEDWKRDVANSPVRLQWDPDHAPTGEPLDRRAIQLGLRGEVIRAYAGNPRISQPSDWITRIEDISEFVAEQRVHAVHRKYALLRVPREAVYPVTDPQLARQLNVGSEPDAGRTICQEAEHGEVGQVLAWLDAGCRVDVADNRARTPLRWAASNGHIEVARLLLLRGADPNAHDDGGGTPLHPAACHGHLDVVRLLIEHGTDIHVRNQQGRTALHLAALDGRAEVVTFLLELGADPNTRDDLGRTPLDDATFYGHKGVIDMLSRF